MATIFEAAGRGVLPLVQRLTDANPKLLNARDRNGRTPLMHACQWGSYQVALFLLDHGAAVNRVDHAGRSALLWTAPTGASLKTIALLLERGADPSLTARVHEDEEAGYSRGSSDEGLGGGATYLMRSCSLGYDQIVRLLLQHGGSNIDMRDLRAGRTALHFACESGKAGAAKLLLDWGADPFVKDEDGRSPLDVARMWDRRDCVQVLEDWMKTYHLYRLRRLRDAADAELHPHQVVRRPLPSWLLQRVREGRPLPRVDVAVPQDADGDHDLNETAAEAEQESDDGASVVEQRCSKRSRSIPEDGLDKAAADQQPPPPPPSSLSQLNHLVKAQAALHVAVERLPTDLFRELLEGSLGALVSELEL